MEAPQKLQETVVNTLTRTVITATIIALVLLLSHVLPQGARGVGTQFGMIWLMVISIVFFGHWLELLFINYLKFALAKSLPMLYLARIAYWFLCAIPLFFVANCMSAFFTGGSCKCEVVGIWLANYGTQLFIHDDAREV